MHYDVVIIGAGMSGLAAGIRLAYFGKSVCILERHYAYGGLNSYYNLAGREFDVGLHALTNYTPPGSHSGPLVKMLRQLRLTRDELQLCEQRFSEVRFPGKTLRFSNDPAMLFAEVEREFPRSADDFRNFVRFIREFDDTPLNHAYQSSRRVLEAQIHDPILREMLLCPVMIYGCAEEHDMDFQSFVIIFKGIFLEGFSRPLAGIRPIIKTLVRKFRSNGGKIRMQCGVESLQIDSERVSQIHLTTGDVMTADTVISCAGYPETMRLCHKNNRNPSPSSEVGQVSYVETHVVLDVLPTELGHKSSIVFFNDSDTFTYAKPNQPVDLRSGVICCPNNYEGHESLPEGVLRLTWLANSDRWQELDDSTYAETKKNYLPSVFDRLEQSAPGLRDHVVFTDMFTPRTIQRYTGRLNGAVYGSPRKQWDGRTPYDNLFICGTDQGYVGIVGALISGITMANIHVLSQ
ncbi:MAG: NAD(P)/FAD-dependent oxidoreductase [Planctomycetota bacterium]